VCQNVESDRVQAGLGPCFEVEGEGHGVQEMRSTNASGGPVSHEHPRFTRRKKDGLNTLPLCDPRYIKSNTLKYNPKLSAGRGMSGNQLLITIGIVPWLPRRGYEGPNFLTRKWAAGAHPSSIEAANQGHRLWDMRARENLELWRCFLRIDLPNQSSLLPLLVEKPYYAFHPLIRIDKLGGSEVLV
jgi:hypothetical protein